MVVEADEVVGEGFVASLVLGLVMDRFGLKAPLAAGAALVAAGLALIGGADRFMLLLPAVACLGFGGGAVNGGANTLVADLHDDARRKAAAGFPSSARPISSPHGLPSCTKQGCAASAWR